MCKVKTGHRVDMGAQASFKHFLSSVPSIKDSSLNLEVQTKQPIHLGT